MIQRIQTVYLILAVVLTFACQCLQIGSFEVNGLIIGREYNLWIKVYDQLAADSAGIYFATWPMFAVLLLSMTLGIYTIFVYSNRRNQARLCTFNLLLLIGWYVLYGVYSRVFIGRTIAESEFIPSVFAAFPAFAIIFYIMAHRGIMADEKLVRAADRIR